MQEDIRNADLAFLNLETPLCLEGDPIDKCGPNLRAHPDCIQSVADAGFNVIGLANNHIMDFGESGLIETIETSNAAGLYTCGAGMNLAESQQVTFMESKDLKIAFIAVAEHEFSIAGLDSPGAAPLDPIDNTFQIEQAREQADLVFVTIHGGNEYFPYPRPGLRKVCKFFINRGADAVICHHAHVPGAYEFFEGKPIVYSLGNLIFDRENSPKDWDKGYAVRLAYNSKTQTFSSLDIIPYTQSVEINGICKMQGQIKKHFLKTLNNYSITIDDEKTYQNVWETFCIQEKSITLLRHYSPLHFKGMRKVSKLFNFEIFISPTKHNKRLKLNTIRCESHLELLKDSLLK
jgi:poly-gamma-glutamate synthesis protein (capsule biosynthesis protein)